MPPRLELMVPLAACCGLRFGELIELRRIDIDSARGIVHVRRGAARVKGAVIIAGAKSDAGRRTVAIPPHPAEQVAEHLAAHVGAAPDALLFPAELGGRLPVASSTRR